MFGAVVVGIAAKQWVDGLEANGGTAIDAALKATLDLRPADTSRTFTVVFFTDGEPTVGETNPGNIVKAVHDRNTANTRIFTFGVGNDVNATLLDSLADSTRAVSTEASAGVFLKEESVCHSALALATSTWRWSGGTISPFSPMLVSRE